MGSHYSFFAESQLISLLKSGDREAWGELYSRYSSRLYDYAFRVVKDGQTAKDIVHDTFLKLWETRDSIKSQTTLGPLLFVISRNLVLNGIRKTVNSKLYEDYVVCRNEICSSHQDIEDKIDYNMYKKRVVSIIQDLPGIQKEIFMLSRLDCLKNKEIAEKLNIQEQTVKNKISMTLKVIREKLFAI